MKPSLRSHIFRFFARLTSAYVASRSGIEAWQNPPALSHEKPRLPGGVHMERIAIGNVPAEWLVPDLVDDAGRVMLYFHGGAWLFGWYNPHRMLVGHIARQARVRALAVDYRLAPQYPFPAALDDCVNAYLYLLDCGIHPEHIVFAGDSAGGNLVITTMLALRQAGKPLPAAGVCISPATDLAGKGESVEVNAQKDAILSSGMYAKLAEAMPVAYAAGHDLNDPLISPLYADLHGLPPLLVQAGEDEILLSSITAFVNQARQDGVQVDYEVWPSMWHVWHIFAPYMPEAQYAIVSMIKFMQESLNV